MFVDEALILCTAGHGGMGCNSLDRSRPGRFRATGGDGGCGGSIIIEARENIQTLLDFQFKKEFIAPNGGHGSSSDKTGYQGQDLWIGVPAGTEIIDNQTGDFLKDLDRVGASVLVCRGGAGGKGNNKKENATDGTPGEHRQIRLRLKLIADVGLVGFPNAGKSTLISRISNAKSKVAAYPFTTKHPVLGVVKFDEGDALVVADIPGIIEGAHEGRGMGMQFLRHVERTKILLHMIDMAAVDGRDPISDYRVMNEELKSYSEKLTEKDQILVATKMDIPEAEDNLKKFKRKVRKELFPISTVTGQGLPQLLNRLRQLKLKCDTPS